MKRIVTIAIAVFAIGFVAAAIAADQKKTYEETKPYDYGATPPPKAEPAPPPKAEPAPPPAAEQQQFTYKPPQQETKMKPPRKERKHREAHKPSRKPFHYDARFMDKDKLRRCMNELPWKGLLKERDSPVQRKEFCQTYQIETWSNQDQEKVRKKLKAIFESKPKPKPQPQPQPPTMGY